ncbi:MAG: sulfatase, partial [Planctomycetes bacterium]|nr:sulfatase [Planctomycetota bacterium]
MRSARLPALILVTPLLLGCGAHGGVEAAEAAARPNLVFVFADDHAYQAISAYDGRLNRTPNIDRIAEEGMRFDRCFVGNSICAPARATVLTGLHSHANGVIDNRAVFDGSQRTMPKLLHAAGYQTAMIGKWHLKSDPTGFDHWEVLIGQGPYYNPPLKTPDGVVEHQGYTTEIITERTLRWLKEERDPSRPFLLMMQHKAPHRNWQPGPREMNLFEGVDIPEPPTLFDDWSGRASAAAEQEMTVARHMSDFDLKLTAPGDLTPAQRAAWEAAYGPRNAAFRADPPPAGEARTRWQYQRYLKDYLRVIDAVDRSVGELLAALEEQGLAQDTLVIYTSDQGFYLGEHGWYDKRWMYEESFRTPLLVRWPGVVEPGSVNTALAQNIDFAPTLLAAAGVAPPADMHGESLLPLLRGESPADWRDSLYYHYYEYPDAHRVARHRGVRTDRYKLVSYYTTDEWELFDLEADPLELRSVHADPAYAAVRAELAAELDRLAARYGEDEPERPREDYYRDFAASLAAQVQPAELLHLAEPSFGERRMGSI